MSFNQISNFTVLFVLIIEIIWILLLCVVFFTAVCATWSAEHIGSRFHFCKHKQTVARSALVTYCHPSLLCSIPNTMSAHTHRLLALFIQFSSVLIRVPLQRRLGGTITCLIISSDPLWHPLCACMPCVLASFCASFYLQFCRRERGLVSHDESGYSGPRCGSLHVWWTMQRGEESKVGRAMIINHPPLCT